MQDKWIRTVDKKEYFSRLTAGEKIWWVSYEERIHACLIPEKESDEWLESIARISGKELELVNIIDDRPDGENYTQQRNKQPRLYTSNCNINNSQ